MPAWLLLPPMWVATGLLARFVVGVPIAAIVHALVSDSLPRVAGGPGHPWVYVVVYIEFAGLGIGFMLAFFLYARTRWAETLQSTHAPFSQAPPTLFRCCWPTRLRSWRWLWCVVFGLGVRRNSWTTGGSRRASTILGSLINGIDSALMMGAAAGVLMIVQRIGGRIPFWLPLAVTWVGAGSLFGWGLWQMINVLGQTALVRGAEGMALVNLVGLLRLVVGLVMGLLTVFLLAERRAPV